MLQQLSVEGSQLQLWAGEELHYSEMCATYPKLVIRNTHRSVSLDRLSTIAGLDWTGLDSSGLDWKRSSATQTQMA